MTIKHHPDDSMLAAFTAGTLDHGQHIAVATHLVSCPQCRTFMRSMEKIGGQVLIGLPPAAMPSGAFAKVEAQLNEPGRAASGIERDETFPRPAMDDLREQDARRDFRIPSRFCGSRRTYRGYFMP